MLRLILRYATLAAFGRAWAQRSLVWLSLGLAVLAFRFLDSRSTKRARRQSA